MIASVRGRVLDVRLDRCVIEVGGAGVLVHSTPGALAGLRRGQEGHLHTELVVREDSLTLYGFETPEACELFVTVQKVTGVGPRLALAVLATLEPAALVTALAGGDVKALTSVPGVGKRTAERMILDLGDKVGPVPGGAGATGVPGQPAPASPAAEVTEALVGLGFPADKAEKAATEAYAAAPEAGTAQALRAALRSLGGR